MNNQSSKYSIKDKIVSKIRRMKVVLRTVSNSTEKIKIAIIKLPAGEQVLPYFKDPISGSWKIVLINQFRPAVKNETFEAPGGMVDAGETISALDYCQFDGIAEISPKMVKKKRAGKKEDCEQTEIKIFNLADILKKRDVHAIQLDLLTSRLIDEVAKVTGLLIKKY